MKIKRAKKGVTLVELTIVLALVAIIGTAVVAFTVALSNRVKNSNAKTSLYNQTRLIEEYVKDWIDDCVKNQGEIVVESQRVTATKGEAQASISKTQNEFKVVKLDGNEKTIKLENGLTVNFNVIEKGNDQLFIIKINGVLTVGEATETDGYVIVYNPKVGDEVKIEGVN